MHRPITALLSQLKDNKFIMINDNGLLSLLVLFYIIGMPGPSYAQLTYKQKLLSLENTSNQVHLKAIVGPKSVRFKYLTLDGSHDKITVDIDGICTALGLRNSYENRENHLKMFMLIPAAKENKQRHWIGLRGNICQHPVSIELDFLPAFVTENTLSKHSALTKCFL